MPSQSRRQAGYSLIELVAMIGIAAVATMLGATAIMSGMDSMRDRTVAQEFQQAQFAAERYVRAHYAELSQQVASGANAAVVLDLDDPTDRQELDAYWPAGLPETNALDQSYRIVVLNANQPGSPNAIRWMIATVGGNEALEPARAQRIATMIGAEGGYAPTGGGTLQGSYGSWALDTATIPGGGGADLRLASMKVVDPRSDENDFLYRYAVPGRPELNAMDTDLDMGGQDIRNIDEVGTTANPVDDVAASGTAQFLTDVTVQMWANVTGGQVTAGNGTDRTPISGVTNVVFGNATTVTGDDVSDPNAGGQVAPDPTTEPTIDWALMRTIEELGTVDCEAGSLLRKSLTPETVTYIDVNGNPQTETYYPLVCDQELPRGALMHFNADSCPVGWTPLVDAQGRIIRGAGSPLGNTVAARLGDIAPEAVGYYEKGNQDTRQTLTARMMPQGVGASAGTFMSRGSGPVRQGSNSGCRTCHSPNSGRAAAFDLLPPVYSLLHCINDGGLGGGVGGPSGGGGPGGGGGGGNLAPVWEMDAIQRAPRAQPVQLLLTARDPEGEAVGYRLMPLEGGCVGLPPGLALNGNLISGTLDTAAIDAAGCEAYLIDLDAFDPQGASAALLLELGVSDSNLPPAWVTPVAIGSWTATDPNGASFLARDPDPMVGREPSDVIYDLEAEQLPNGVTFNGSRADPQISGTPTETGDFWIVLRATDLSGASSIRRFELTVTDPLVWEYGASCSIVRVRGGDDSYTPPPMCGQIGDRCGVLNASQPCQTQQTTPGARPQPFYIGSRVCRVDDGTLPPAPTCT